MSADKKKDNAQQWPEPSKHLRDPHRGPGIEEDLGNRAERKEQRSAKDYAHYIVDTVHDALLVLRKDLRIEAANRAFYETFQTEPEETLGRSVFEFMDAQWDTGRLRELLEEILPEDEELVDFEIEQRFEGLGRRVMLFNARRLDNLELILLAIEDVTEERQAEEKLRKREREFVAVANNIPQLAWMVDSEGNLFWCNQRWHEYTGTTLEEVKGWEWQKVIHPEHVDRVIEGAEETFETGGPWEDTFPLRSRHGDYRWFLSRAMPIRDEDGHLVRWFGTNTDITERLQLEEELKELNERLEERVKERTRQVETLAAALAEAEEKERERIADVLHDEVQQLLYGAELALRTLRRRTGELPYEELRQELQEDLGHLEEALNEAQESTRTLSVELSPPLLRGEDLRVALRWLARHFEERYSLSVELDLAEDFHLPDEAMRRFLFQLTRELLFNVVKHAEAKEAQVRGRRAKEAFHLEVSDEGRGFEEARVLERQPKGRGLHAIKARLELLGGELSVETAPGEGTCVTIGVPAAAEEEAWSIG